MKPARKFLEGIIDYAGLFPPSSLSMEDAVREYASYRNGVDRDLLGRFIAPAARLDELALALGVMVGEQREPWRISVTTGKEFLDGSHAARQFNSEQAVALCDALEAVAATANDVEHIVANAAPAFELYIEVPVDPDPAPVIAAIAGTRASAKIRTGGVIPSAIPSPDQVLRFMFACRQEGVPFKATAGLHHIIRSEYPLTYESDAPAGTMFGYLNIFLAAAAIEDGWHREEVLGILEDRDASHFELNDDGALVNGRLISRDILLKARSGFATSFGSCSFTEPVSEARALGLI